MSGWKALPPHLDQRVREFVVQLRGWKDMSRLTLAQVAAKTGYSKASWQRYFSGRNLPPRQAVEAFARACGADPTRLLAFRDVAADALAATAKEQEQGEGTARQAESPVAPPDAPRRRPLRIAGACGTLMAAAVTLLAVRPWQHPAPAAAPHYACRISHTGDRWYAGLSRTSTAIVQEGMAGSQVAEVQCLLRRAGFSPGDIDGIFGELTQRAVRRLQAAHALPTDGVVGPLTWGALRG